MNVPTITMDPAIARKKLSAYRADLHKDTEEVYRETALAYETLAKGLPLIRLSRAIQQAGFFPDMRPKLAVARADRKEVEFRWWSGEVATFDCSKDFEMRRSRFHTTLCLSINMGQNAPRNSVIGYTLIPMVPADVRPPTGQLKDWHILWEVEHWASRPQTSRAPVDPMLLRHVGGDLYAVLATWDLTAVEQAILEGALRS